MDSLTNHPLLKRNIVTKMIDEVVVDPGDYRGASLVPTVESNTDKVIWDVRFGVGGMTQAVAIGAESPLVETRGLRQESFEPGHFREKIVLGETDLRDIRKFGTTTDQKRATEIIAEKVADLRMRVENRIEWARWQMILGTISVNSNGVQYVIDYKIPPSMNIYATDLWSDLGGSDPVADIIDWKFRFRRKGARPVRLWINSQTERYLLSNSIMKNRFNQLLAGGRDSGLMSSVAIDQVIKTFANGMDYTVYDEGVVQIGELATAASSGGTSLVLKDATGFVAGNIVTVHDDVGDSDDTLVSSISTNTLTVLGQPKAWAVGSRVTQRVPFIPDNKVIVEGQLPAGTVGGRNFAEFMMTNSVYGRGSLVNPQPGIFAQTNVFENHDPPRVEIIAGVNGLPVMYHRDVNLVAQVAA